MTPSLLAVFLAAAILIVALAVIVVPRTASLYLAVAAAILSGVVLVVDLVTY